MTLTIAISYGGMWDIVQAAKRLLEDVQQGRLSSIDGTDIDEYYFNRYTCLSDLPKVDMLIRTGGEYRLSNFLIWQSAYAELFFTKTLWPDFAVAELKDLIQQFGQRERRFGQTSEQIQAHQKTD
jgi:undecaprenyl diphosphate synthase